MSMLAKDPKNRPADAIKLSEAAEAIRNGDIAAAHAAVPGMLLFEAATGPITAPVDVPTAATSVIGSSAAEDKSTSATSALPVVGAAGAGAAAGLAAGAAAASGYGARNALNRADALAAERSWVQEEEDDDYDEPEEEPKRRGRSPWTWPLIALILLVVFALVGVVLSQAGSLFPSQGPASEQCHVQHRETEQCHAVGVVGFPDRDPHPHAQLRDTHRVHPGSDQPDPGCLPGAAVQRCPQRTDRQGAASHRCRGRQRRDARHRHQHRSLRCGPAGHHHHASATPRARKWSTVPSIKAGASEAEVQQAIQDAGLRWAKGADVESHEQEGRSGHVRELRSLLPGPK